MKPTIQDENGPAANSGMPRRLGVAAGIICFCVICALEIQVTSRSTSSTAPIGLIFLPIVAAVLSIPAFAAGWCLGYFLVWRRSSIKRRKVLAMVAGLVPVVLGAWIFQTVWDGRNVSRQVHRIQRMNAGELEAVLNRPDWAGNKFILGAIAQNPNATAATLHRIAALDRPDLQEPMGSHFDVMGKNTKGLAVMRLIARHPNTAAEDLERLAASTNRYVLGDLATNPKLSEATLRRLANQGGFLIELGLASNRQTPQDILSGLARSRNDYTRNYVAANPNTPPDALAALGSDQIALVRARVAQNPSTPPGTIEQLRKDVDETVRAAATANNHTPGAPQ